VHPILKKSMSELLHNINCDDIKRRWPIGDKLHDFDNNVLLFGILNITPDSFSDGGQFYGKDDKSLDAALDHALHLVNSGADVLDIGGESTRPGASIVSIDDEMNRVIPVIQYLRKNGVTAPISIDTRNSKVAEAAIKCGANIINDISGGKYDKNMFSVASNSGVPIIIMHSRGTPETMSNDENTTYNDVVQDVSEELMEQMQVATSTGVAKWHQWIDPGIGFAKKEKENLKLLNPTNLKALKQNLEGRPMMIGASRKRFLNSLLPSGSDKNINDKDLATLAASCIAISGGASMLRVHNVRDLKIASGVYFKILNSQV
jgi:dihydropteroate synthase